MYILPKPQHMISKEGSFTIPYNGVITIGHDLSDMALTAAKLLRDEVNKRTGFQLKISKSFDTENKKIILKKGQVEREQGYKLNIEPEGIIITAAEEIGLLYGVQTLRQIINQQGAVLTCLYINDYPSLLNRGYFHDATRGRIQKMYRYKQLADTAAFYKLNQLQLYIEHTYLFEGFSEVCRDDTPLSASDILELDAYCASLGIDLIPSVASFGHLDKVLKTKTFAHLCELPDSDKEVFTFQGRMAHHTLDVSNEESFIFIKKMLDEFIPLFRSNYFNINGDETFDLGKGRSKVLADEMGTHELYVSVISKICSFIKARGKQPMFWGDIIVGSPELMKDLPEDVICLNWGYSEKETETNAKKMHDVGAKQYLCPGVQGWRLLMNRLDLAYENITRMCSYAQKYGAIGVLNTDWGDYGHVSDPDFAIPGLIYGAAFTWNFEQDKRDVINRQISVIEYHDSSERLVSLASELAMQEGWNWGHAVRYMEADTKDMPDKERQDIMLESSVGKSLLRNRRIDELLDEMNKTIVNLSAERRGIVYKYQVHARMQKAINNIAVLIAENRHQMSVHEDQPVINAIELSSELELAFMDYKELWRESSRESELYRVQNVVFYYADLLRNISVSQ